MAMIEEAFSLMAKDPSSPLGVLCEFGVWKGDGLEQIEFNSRRNLGGSIPVYGFDSFEGMPPTSVHLTNDHAFDWREGSYSDTSVEAVRRRFAEYPMVHIVKGVFANLPPLASLNIESVRFARLDCDIYEGYRDALALLTPTIRPGTLLLFDEGAAPDDPRYHDSIRDSGIRAIDEWQAGTGWRLRDLHVQWTERLTIVEGRAS